MEQDRAARICALNDELRRNRSGGKVMITCGVAEFAPDLLQRVLKRIASFNEWDADNDPHGEHDFGLVNIEGTEIMFKIDYYDPSLQYGSDDPADPAKTVRVMTIMRADEY